MTIPFIFFGTPEFCIDTLDILASAGHIPTAIVCQPDRPKGRGRKVAPLPVKEWAQTRFIRVIQPNQCKHEDFLDCLIELEPELGLVFAFGQLLPKQLLDIPRLGFINIHPSILPRYRGAAPLQWALINGDSETGVSILKVTPRLDDGDIILQEKVAIDPDENAVELGNRLARLGGELVVQVLDRLAAGNVAAVPQGEDQVIWAPALTKSDGKIDWNQTTESIHNRIRGVQPWPGAFTHLGEKILKIHKAGPAVVAQTEGRQPGQVIEAAGTSLVVATLDGGLALAEVQLEGKKRLDAKAFLLGRTIQKGDILR
ncbi:MAG: methionyl-tRNA formyltransferase [Deltaproteobacteria bacterium]|nr:methionyl-tRNA formyltransferase [Deltaproteobacteria bacterium]